MEKLGIGAEMGGKKLIRINTLFRTTIRGFLYSHNI